MVKIENELSSKLKIQTGVPRGTVLGSIKFLIYINSIQNLIYSFIC